MKKIFIIITICTLMVAMSICLEVSSLTASAGRSITDDSSVFGEVDSWEGLNAGCYWLCRDNTYIKANSQAASEFEGYDSTKPTLLYTHGFQSDQGYKSRETLAAHEVAALIGDDTANLGEYWLDAGYNVLYFFWNQICDEQFWDITKVEAKIWSKDSPLGLRWRDKNGNYSELDDESNIKVSVTEYYINEVIEILGTDYNGPELRMAGHSMGGLLSISAMDYLKCKYEKGEITANLIPTRLSLLDPLLGMALPEASNPSGTFNIAWRADDDPFKDTVYYDRNILSKTIIKELHEMGVAIDYYFGSQTGEWATCLSSHPDDFPIDPYVVLINIDNENVGDIGTLGLTEKVGADHVMVRDFFLYSIKDEDVALAGDYVGNAPLASTPNAEIYALSGRKFGASVLSRTLDSAGYEFIPVIKITPNDIAFDTPATVENGGLINGTISGFAFIDLNENGIRDNGEAFEQVKKMEVSLYSANGSKVSAVTASENGYYSFDISATGDYYLTFETKRGSEFFGSDNTSIQLTSSAVNTEGRSDIFTITSPYEMVNINAAYLNKTNTVLYFIIGLAIVVSLTVVILIREKRKLASENTNDVKVDEIQS